MAISQSEFSIAASASSCGGSSNYLMTTASNTNGYAHQIGSTWIGDPVLLQPWGYGDQYVPPGPQTAPYSPYQFPQPTVLDGHLEALRQLQQSQQQKETPLNRGLFEVFAVFILDDEVYSAVVAAKDEAAARLKAFKVLDLDDPDEFTFIVRRIGDLPARKEIQKVRVVKDSE